MINKIETRVIKPTLPSFYKSKAWKESAVEKPLMERLRVRIEEVKKILPNLTLTEKRELWINEPYYEVSKLIVESKDWQYPKPNEKL